MWLKSNECCVRGLWELPWVSYMRIHGLSSQRLRSPGSTAVSSQRILWEKLQLQPLMIWLGLVSSLALHFDQLRISVLWKLGRWQSGYECSLCKNEDLSLNPQHQCQHWGCHVPVIPGLWGKGAELGIREIYWLAPVSLRDPISWGIR